MQFQYGVDNDVSTNITTVDGDNNNGCGGESTTAGLLMLVMVMVVVMVFVARGVCVRCLADDNFV